MEKTFRLCAIFCLASGLSVTAAASSISINSTCVVGTCSSADVLAVNSMSSNPFNFTYTFANSDQYLLTGLLTVITMNGTALGVSDFLTTYQGNASGSNSGNDVLQADFLQNIANRTSYSTTASEGVEGTFGAGLAFASSASGQAFFDSQALPLLGPFYAAGAPTFTGSATGTVRVPAGTPLIDYRYTLKFAEGSQPGASIGVNPTPMSVTPEPGSLALLSTGLVAVVTLWRRQRQTESA